MVISHTTENNDQAFSQQSTLSRTICSCSREKSRRSPRLLCGDMGGHRDFGSLSCVDWDPRAMDDEVEDEWALPQGQGINQETGQDANQEDEVPEVFAEEVDEYTSEVDDEDEEENQESFSGADDDYPDEFLEDEEDDEPEPSLEEVEEGAIDAIPLPEEEFNEEDWPPSQSGELHMYYSNLSSLANVHIREPNLTVLSLIGQPLENLDGVENLRNLKELWAVECKLNNVTAVERCVSLEKLYLYSNRIREVPQLDGLPRLRVLWLASNDILTLDRVPKAPALTELNMSKNRITSLTAHWGNCVALTTLNLSANPLYMLTDILPLRDAPNLQTVQLADPMYGDSPVTQLCNYRSYVVHELPSIICLEQLVVTEEERNAVDAFYTEKDLYYNMLRHHFKNLYLKEDKERTGEYFNKIRAYKGYYVKYKLKQLWRDEKDSDCTESLSIKMEHLNYKIKLFEKDLRLWRRFHTSSLETRIQQITLEQQHTGNLRFREFSGDCEPMVICQRLLDSYVCRHLKIETGISGAELLEVTHVTNKGLEVISNLRMGSKTRRSSSIMLLAPPDGLSKPTNWPFDVVKRGFINSGEFEINVTNCLYYADHPWMMMTREARRLSSPPHNDVVPVDGQYERRVAVVVIFSRETMLLPAQRDHVSDEIPPREPNAEPHPAHFYLPRGSAAGPGSGKPCCKYMVANAQLVLAMIVLEFRYVIVDPLEEFRKRMAWTSDVHEQCVAPTGPAVGILEEESMGAAVGAVRRALCNIGTFVASLTTLVLTACGITILGNLPKMETIVVVDLSFNKLASLRGIDAFSGVKELDLSYNNLTLSEETARPKLPQLKCLDLSWNNISRLLQSLTTLRRLGPELSILDLSHNPVEDVIEPSHFAYVVRKCIRHLVRLNGEHIDDLVQTKKDSGNNPVWADVHEWEILRKPVSLRWLVETRMNNQEGGEGKLTTNSAFPYWLCYKGLSLTDIKLKEQFHKVKWADFSDNYLEEFKKLLVEMPQLEKLSIRHNLIQDFPVFTHKWTQLRKLDLSDNYLKSIATFQCGAFPSLKVLDVSGNMLSDLNGIQACEDLVECYAACNRIACQASIIPAKNCRTLRMLDLTGNPVEKLRDFRPFCVFHIRELEFLCGQAVEESDMAEAADKFGGRLDHEFLLKTPHALELSTLRSLSLVNSCIRKVILPSDVLPHLERLDLSNNNISSLWGLHMLPSLKTLRLSFNQVASLRPNGNGPLVESAESSPATHSPTPASSNASSKPSSPFPSLRMLLLDNNRLASAKMLGLREMPNLSSLFLQQNELDSLEGLQCVASLRFLVLDENRLHSIGPAECRGLACLEELWAESNRLSQLCFTHVLRGLRRLFLAGNCIADPSQLRHLAALEELREITLSGNPVTRRRTFQAAVREYVPWVETLDGQPLESSLGGESDSNTSA